MSASSDRSNHKALPVTAEGPEQDENSDDMTRREFIEKASGLTAASAFNLSEEKIEKQADYRTDEEKMDENSSESEGPKRYFEHRSIDNFVEVGMGEIDDNIDTYMIPEAKIDEIEDEELRKWTSGDYSALDHDLSADKMEHYSNLLEETAIGQINPDETIEDFKDRVYEDFPDIEFDKINLIDGEYHVQTTVEEQEDEVFSDKSLVGHESYHGDSMDLNFKDGKAYLEMRHKKLPQNILSPTEYMQARENKEKYEELGGDEEVLFNLYQLMEE